MFRLDLCSACVTSAERGRVYSPAIWMLALYPGIESKLPVTQVTQMCVYVNLSLMYMSGGSVRCVCVPVFDINEE